MFPGEFLQARNSQSSCCIGDQAEKENALLQNQVRKKMIGGLQKIEDLLGFQSGVH